MRGEDMCRGPRGFRMPDLPMGFPGIGPLGHLLMGVDIDEDVKNLTISVPLPGVTKEDIELNVGPDTVVITLKEKAAPEEEPTGAREEMGFRPWSVHMGFGLHGTRRFPLPTEVDPDTAKAKLENGILKVTAEKKNPGKKIFS